MSRLLVLALSACSATPAPRPAPAPPPVDAGVADAAVVIDAPVSRWTDAERNQIIDDGFRNAKIQRAPFSAVVGATLWQADKPGRIGIPFLRARADDDPARSNFDYRPGRKVYLYDCNGYVGEATVARDDDNVFFHASVLASTRATKPRKRCATATEHEPIFALTSKRGTHTRRVDDDAAATAYRSLPPAILRWVAEIEEVYRRPASTTPDAWADTDGDGGVDLVAVTGRCKVDDYACGLVLVRSGTTWIPIGISFPL